MRREIPWNWYRPGPEREAARLRAKASKARTEEAARALARAADRAARQLDRDGEIRRLWSEGMSGTELCERFGLSKSTVSRIVAGLRRPRRYGDPWEVAWPYPRRFFRAAPTVAPASHPRTPLPPEPADSLQGSPSAMRGSANGRAVLDEAKVARMKRLRLELWSTGRLAREFKVGRNTVCYILTGKTWGHVEPAPPEIGGVS